MVIIGGGASGMMAALSAGRQGYKTLLIEKNNKLGKKILATGNGRCNFTNVFASSKDYNSDFVLGALSVLSVKDTLKLFDDLGLMKLEEGQGRCYPASEQAQSIMDVIEEELKRLKVEILYEKEVRLVTKNNGLFKLDFTDSSSLISKNVIVATGGISLPQSGSTGDGYTIAKTFGHSITSLVPSLTRLKLKHQYLNEMSGVRFTNNLKLISDNQVIDEVYDDVIFNKTGISGLGILSLSKQANFSVNANKKTTVVVRLVDSNEETLLKRFNRLSYKTVFNGLVGLINKKLIIPVLEEAGIKNYNRAVSSLNKQEVKKLIKILLGFEFEVIGSDGFDDAQVTSGGVNLEEVNKTTLESLLVEGLYFTGEVLDIDGKSGGYNLQWAWSSGYLAGLLKKEIDKNV
ncbi:MAG: NAD(P)/FAD-dependent oxidoreductase [Acholeplasmataceae bacterium]|nr:NAD(P)/FAD-dependent oxidoreductase [Acholeplasmataceae bacterium]MDD4204424.1 NAD(P)/FAD-dependent oxidoreductase [Acholeplasmataceae bacterium]MDD4469390.1 NAD(P)/FAD-dependent oxidoreductase [Acholeplasmataceae bacterium]MDD4824587.1 NAD(P)/FAD-dependent oxidoreductase [Acholeplasmataceae bacterium]